MPAVGGHQPVAAAVRRGGHAHDGPVEVDVAGRAVEGGVAEGEDAAVGGDLPVAAAVRGGGHAHDGLVGSRSLSLTGPGSGAVECVWRWTRSNQDGGATEGEGGHNRGGGQDRRGQMPPRAAPEHLGSPSAAPAAIATVEKVSVVMPRLIRAG